MRFSTLVVALVALAFSPGWSLAQIALPVFDPQKDGGQPQKMTFEDAKKSADFRHGALLRVTLNDDSKVEGTLVRVDRKATRIYLRTEPGAAPRAIAQKEIKKVEKATRDSIRPAGMREDAVTPEIHQIAVFSGASRSVRYFGPNLSPEELRSLQELEDAENEFARLDQLHMNRSQLVDNEVAIQGERLTSHHLINDLLRQQVWSGFWVLPLAPSYHQVVIQHDQPELAKLVAALPSFEAWTKARDNARSLRSHAVVEDGRIVAMVVAEK
ncbi:MAG: hypothetical protein HY040_12075 [Planctomycetes bacterium]|nr:hypothetical protein [Planctomycetota bacterium]